MIRVGSRGSPRETGDTEIPVIVACLVGAMKAHGLAIELYVADIAIALFILAQSALFDRNNSLVEFRAILTIADMHETRNNLQWTCCDDRRRHNKGWR